MSTQNQKMQTLHYTLLSKNPLTHEETELYELCTLAGVTLDPDVFKIFVDLLRMNVAPTAIDRMLKSVVSHKMGKSDVELIQGLDAGHEPDIMAKSSKDTNPTNISQTGTHNLAVLNVCQLEATAGVSHLALGDVLAQCGHFVQVVVIVRVKDGESAIFGRPTPDLLTLVRSPSAVRPRLVPETMDPEPTPLSRCLRALFWILLTSPPAVHGNWMYLGVASIGLDSNPSPHICNLVPGLVYQQLRVCQDNPEAMPCVSLGAKLGIIECHDQFKYERWNCTTSSSYTVFGPVLEKGQLV
ncbi:hypothetical protein LSH36_114g01024 [Paralvinella palmiformis]|uniref:Protein Wnt n=1 Tax=Paralvinella palmiformis TaxID=53620 RepID=A0AAD9N987_9ANNE|nr:hypothetical protein LSH36_114g01024 [Paralvinella palmiformis]